MPWLEMAMKDVAKLRWVSGRCQATFDPKSSEWGNPVRQNLTTRRFSLERTLGSETSQYQVEKKPIGISLVAASETERAQTEPRYYCLFWLKVIYYFWKLWAVIFGFGVVRLQRNIYVRKVTKVYDSGISWKAKPQRVMAPYTKS